jgi:SAM-dependent methyltransferase
VTAVEPQPSMREVLAGSVGPDRVLEGVAEAIPLGDDSVWAVTVADGFHWFDAQPALAEIRRVLAPGGGLALLSTIPDWSGASWADELGQTLMRLRPEHPYFDGPPWQEAVGAAEGWTEPRQIRVTTTQPARPERMADYLVSMSWIAAMPEAQREETIAEVAALVMAGETPPEMDVHVVVGLTSLA